MNRAIKFRGRRLDNGEWVFGMLDTIYQSDGFTTISYLDHEGYYCEEKVIAVTVGQFTGLVDKNGKEVYEGDICKNGYTIKYVNGSTNDFYQNDVVEYDIPNCTFVLRKQGKLAGKRITTRMIVERSIEIIGNIHDNLELLKE